MSDLRRDLPLQPETSRSLWIGWGAQALSLGLAILLGGTFFAYLFVFGAVVMITRGCKPGLFADHFDEQLIAGIPYRRKESVKRWIIATVLTLLCAISASLLHHKVLPEKPDLAKAILEEIQKLARSQPIAPQKPPITTSHEPPIAPAPSPSLPISIPYVYLDGTEERSDNQDGLIVAIRMRVRDYPTTNEARHRIASISSVENVHLVARSPVALSPDENGWSSCVVTDVRRPQWNNDNGTFEKLADFSVGPTPSIIEFRITTQSGVSGGIFILRMKKGYFEREEWVSGNVLSRSGEKVSFSVHETLTQEKYVIEDGGTPIEINKKLLAKYGIPTESMTGEKLKTKCSNGYSYSAVVPKGFKRGTLQHNFGNH